MNVCRKLATGALRNSVRITTQAAYDIGSLFVMDAYHVPYGVSAVSTAKGSRIKADAILLLQCAVWPAFWTHARSWPSGGEQDIFEGVNLASTNQAALHTVVGCTVAGTTTNVTQSGTLTFNDCDYSVAANHGCTYTDARNQSYGQPFADAGGGIFVAETSSNAISMWFFPVRAAFSTDPTRSGGLTVFPIASEQTSRPTYVRSTERPILHHGVSRGPTTRHQAATSTNTSHPSKSP